MNLKHTFLWLLVGAASAQTPDFYDNFKAGSLDTAKWDAADRRAAGSNAVNKAVASPGNIDLSSGMLVLKMTQEQLPNGVVRSTGAQIESKQMFGYGTYAFTMRMASTSSTPNGKGLTASGSVSSGFAYVNNSETELDIEFLGDTGYVWFTNWRNPSPTSPPRPEHRTFHKFSVAGLADGFHRYLIVWAPDSVKWYVDGSLLATHKQHVPSAPARMIIQLRGTNAKGWGGLASPNVTRYLYVTNASFTSLGKKKEAQ